MNYARKHKQYSLRRAAWAHEGQNGRRALDPTPVRLLVGATGFEPATLCSQSRCATKLRHAPLRSRV